MDLERERGITIQAPVTINYTLDGQTYELNLIDTPGHVDFNYEVSRSLAACEGAILLVDAFQGVQAQTVANAYLAMNDEPDHRAGAQQDRPAGRPARRGHRRDGNSPGHRSRPRCWPSAARPGRAWTRSSGRSSSAFPARRAIPTAPLQALVYNSHFDTYKGVVVYVRVKDGTLRVGQKIRLMAGGTEHEVTDLGQFRPREDACDELGAGQVGYFMAQIKTLSDVHIGDTVTDARARPHVALPGYKEPKPMVFSGLFPANNNDFETCARRCGSWRSTTPASPSSPRRREGLGFGFRCGFLGMLHREIIQQRLERDSDLSLVQTAPNVTYEILTRKGETLHIANPPGCPTPGRSRSSASRSSASASSCRRETSAT